VHHGRVIKRTGDGALVEFRSVVDAVRCAIEVQSGMVERNAGLPAERRIEFRIGIHVGDVVEESDGDLMGDGVNIAARLEGVAKPNGICLSEDAYRQVRARLDLAVNDLGPIQLKNIAEPIRAYLLEVGGPVPAKPAAGSPRISAPSTAPRLSIIVLPFANIGGDPEQEYFVDGVTESLTTDLSAAPLVLEQEVSPARDQSVDQFATAFGERDRNFAAAGLGGRARRKYAPSIVLLAGLLPLPQLLAILADGKAADEGEQAEGQDGEAGIGGGRIDHAEGDGGDREACGQGHEPPAWTVRSR
jgi:hypothetical protein